MTNHDYTYEQVKAVRSQAAEIALSGTTKNHDHYDDDDISVHAAARAVDLDRKWNPEDGDRILEAYLDNICDRMTSAVAHMLENAYIAGLEVDEIIMAIEETAFAPHPSPRYLRAVLKDWIEKGYTESKIRHYAASNNTRVCWWQPGE